MEKLSDLNADANPQVNELKARVKKLEEEKEAIQNEAQVRLSVHLSI